MKVAQEVIAMSSKDAQNLKDLMKLGDDLKALPTQHMSTTEVRTAALEMLYKKCIDFNTLWGSSSRISVLDNAATFQEVARDFVEKIKEVD